MAVGWTGGAVRPGGRGQGCGQGRVVGGAFKVNKNLVGGEKGRSSRLGFPEAGTCRACMCVHSLAGGGQIGKGLKCCLERCEKERPSPCWDPGSPSAPV